VNVSERVPQSGARLRAVVIDDERLARHELGALLDAHEAIEVVGSVGSIDQALEAIARLRPDVIFLDIQLSPGTGFDLLDRLDHPVRIVFVTAFDAYALRAFEVNALDYLLKPINPDRLGQAVARLMATADATAVAQSAPAPATASPARTFTSDDRIFVEAHGRARFLRVSEVVSITADGDYSQLCAADGQRWLVLKSLREWEARLPPHQFARIHRSIIVNLDCVERIESVFGRGQLVHLRGQMTAVPMSRRRGARLKSLFG
jgi:two-component system LytT family response regulator